MAGRRRTPRQGTVATSIELRARSASRDVGNDDLAPAEQPGVDRMGAWAQHRQRERVGGHEPRAVPVRRQGRVDRRGARAAAMASVDRLTPAAAPGRQEPGDEPQAAQHGDARQGPRRRRGSRRAPGTSRPGRPPRRRRRRAAAADRHRASRPERSRRTAADRRSLCGAVDGRAPHAERTRTGRSRESLEAGTRAYHFRGIHGRRLQLDDAAAHARSRPPRCDRSRRASP